VNGERVPAADACPERERRVRPRLPKIGVAVIVQRGGRVLLGLRRSDSHGDGCWQFPGGHLEDGESVEECAAREALEETGLVVTNLRLGPWTNDHFAAEGKHYITMFVMADAAEGEPQPMEPTKCAEWRWCAWDALPAPLFLPVRNLLANGFTPSH
jgi:8-oxo-dGTP diphosphatase